MEGNLNNTLIYSNVRMHTAYCIYRNTVLVQIEKMFTHFLFVRYQVGIKPKIS